MLKVSHCFDEAAFAHVVVVAAAFTHLEVGTFDSFQEGAADVRQRLGT